MEHDMVTVVPVISESLQTFHDSLDQKKMAGRTGNQGKNWNHQDVSFIKTTQELLFCRTDILK